MIDAAKFAVAGPVSRQRAAAGGCRIGSTTKPGTGSLATSDWGRGSGHATLAAGVKSHFSCKLTVHQDTKLLYFFHANAFP
jgi:hypothetical protein